MTRHRLRLSGSWQKPPFHGPGAGDHRGDYDFHAFRLEIKDVIWAWAVVGGVVLLLSFLL